MGSGDTLRWRGVMLTDVDGHGLTIAGLRLFLDEADAMAAEHRVSIEEQTFEVLVRRGRAHRLWVGVVRRERRGRLRLLETP